MGIFNSKNLKKAVNMVASSSPVINAISQATDIVDKSMDVIDKILMEEKLELLGDTKGRSG